MQVDKDYCPEKLKPGGCQLHNLQCRFPGRNKPPMTRELSASEWQSKYEMAVGIVAFYQKKYFELLDSIRDAKTGSE